MNPIVERTLQSVTFGTPQTHRSITIFPLILPGNTGPEYLTLAEALASELITITEVNKGGSVPELMVKNGAEKPVLLLDGEELRGAKQNRVCNTTILLKEKSETVIPVSCTEHGRWSYNSPKFADSDVVMERRARSGKVRSVNQNLRMHSPQEKASPADYRSNQGKVWEDIATLHDELMVESSTGAMRDAYVANESRITDSLQAFPCIERQHGILVLHRGHPAGLDLLSRSDAYRRVHNRLLKSYVISGLSGEVPTPSTCTTDDASAFIHRILTLNETAYPSVGYGTDYRYEGETTCGAVLAHDDTAIHAAFFEDTPREHGGEFANYRHRARRYRGGIVY